MAILGGAVANAEQVRKAWAAFVISLVGGLGAWAPVALSDGHMAVGDWYGLGGVILTVASATFSVWFIPNEPAAG